MAISSWKRSFQIRQLFIQKTKVKHILIGFQLTIFSPGRHSKWEKPYLTTSLSAGISFTNVLQNLDSERGVLLKKLKFSVLWSCRLFFSPVLFYLCIFYWQIIALQCCGDLCDTSMQISHNHIYICMYIPSLLSLPSLPILQYYFMK